MILNVKIFRLKLITLLIFFKNYIYSEDSTKVSFQLHHWWWE